MPLNGRTLRPSSNWTPKSISGMALWLDGSDTRSLYTTDAGVVAGIDIASLYPSNIALWLRADGLASTDAGASPHVLIDGSNRVSQWADEDVTQNYASPTNSSTRPLYVPNVLNGKPVIRFDGTNDLFGDLSSGFVTGQNRTIFVVCRINGVQVNNARVLSLANVSSDSATGQVIPCMVNSVSSTQLVAYGDGSNLSAVSGFENFGVFSLVTSQTGASTASVTCRGNGSAGTAGSANSTTEAQRFGIGCTAQDRSSKFIGDIAEILVYSVALSDSERASVEKTLAIKYGLDSVHAPISTQLAAVSSPLELRGCVGWWDSADLSSMKQGIDGSGSVAVGDPVGYWMDKSSSAAHVAASTTAKRPTLTASAVNGNAAIVFSSAAATSLNRSAYTATNSLSGLTRIAVCQSTANNVCMMARVITGGSADFLYLNGGIRLAYDTSSATNLTSNTSVSSTGILPLGIYADTFIGSTPSVTAFHYNGTQQTTSTIGTLPSTTSAGSPALYIGSNSDVNFFWTGPIAEYIIFNRALSQNELDRVEKYLAAKWGISNVPDPAPPVGQWQDKSGNSRHATQVTAGKRPTISATLTNGKRALAFNGTSSTLTISNYAGESGVSGLTRYMVMSQPTGAGFLTGTGGSGGNFFQQVSFEGRFFAGSAYRSVSMPSYSYLTAGTRILSSVYSGAAGTVSDGIQPYGDGALLPQLATSGTLPTTLSGSASTYFLGSNLNANNFFNGRTLEVLTYNRALTSTERRRVEQYLATKYGITLAPQVSNPDAQDWINRVYSNNGSVSSSTAAAVNAFCDSIDSVSGLRACFYRLNLFCGGASGTTAGLAACLVPLYRSTAYGGTVLGSATDANTGSFVVGDYAETGTSGGLTNTTAGNYLKTGLTTSALPQIATGHLSVYASTLPTAGIYGLISSWASGFGDPIYLLEANRNGAVQLITSWGNNYPGVNISSGAGAGLLMTSRTAGTTLKSYRNGSQIGTTSVTPITPVANTGGGFGVFANIPQDGSAGNYFPGRIAGYSIGAGMDDSQAAAFSTAMTAFQTALTRNV